MRYELEFSNKAKKELFALPKPIQKRIVKKLRFFLENKPLDFAKSLKGQTNRFRFRIGDYRVIFSKRENGKLVLIVILKVAHRKEVYESL